MKPESSDSGKGTSNQYVGMELVGKDQDEHSSDCGSGILTISNSNCSLDRYADGSQNSDPEKVDTPKKVFKKDMSFNSFGEFINSLKEYKEETFTHLRMRDSKKNNYSGVDLVLFPKSLVHYVCVYHRDPRTISQYSVCKGTRPKQAYFASNCPFELTISYFKKLGCYKVTKFCDSHVGHEVSRSSYESHPQYRKVGKDEVEKYGNYACNLGVPNHVLREQIYKDTGKKLKNQDIVNLKHKFLQDRNVTDIDTCISLLQTNAGKDPFSNLQIVYDETHGNKIIKCIFWQSSHMKKLFNDFGTVLFMDGTYNLTNRGYILVTISVKDNHDQGKMIAWALLSQENKLVLGTMLECLCVGNSQAIKNVRYVVIDKDFTEIASLHKILPHVHFVICRYHTIKAVSMHVSEHKVKSNELTLKSRIADLFVAMVYANTEDEYMRHWEAICSIEGSLEIEALKDYLDKFWHTIREHWAFYILKTKELFDSFTNNRSEALNKNIQGRITKNSKFETVVQMLFNLASNQEKSLLVSDFESKSKLYQPHNMTDIYHEEIVRLGNALVTREVLNCLENQYQKSLVVDLDGVSTKEGQIKCPLLVGPCKYSCTNSRPCAHLFAVRKLNKEVMLMPEMFAKHWLQKSSQSTFSREVTEERQAVFKQMPGKKEKFATVNKVCKQIASTVSDMKKSESEYNLAVLSQVQEAIREGIQISFDGKNIEAVNKRKLPTGEFEFDNSQGPSFKHDKQPCAKKSKLEKKEGKIKENQLNAWQKLINKNMVKAYPNVDQWNSNHFLDFTTTGWLNDTHMEYFCALMRTQFPHIICHDTFDYQVLAGFPPAKGKKFIQIVHSGTDHWAVLTNQGVSEENSNSQVIVYDSLVQLQGKTKCLVKPAVEWQACQLLKRGTDPHPEPIVVHTFPCQQQNNGYDCGVFALANAISLAFNLKPEEISYTENMRTELLEMLLNGILTPLKTISQHTFTRNTIVANMHVNVELSRMQKRIEGICYCRMPESFGDIIQCQICNLTFHQKCFLIDSTSGIAEKLGTFFCYGCRKIGDYSYIAKKWTVPDVEACYRVAKAIQTLQSNKVSIISRVKSIQAEKLFCTGAQYLHFEHFVIKYDLNRVCTKTGDIFNAMYNFYCNADNHVTQKYPFDSLSLSELFQMAILLICKVENLSLPPYVIKERYTTLKSAIVKNRKWIGVLTSTGVRLNKNMKELLESGRSYMDRQDKVSTIMSEVTTLSVYAEEAKNALQENYADTTEREQKQKDQLLNQLTTIKKWVQKISEDMNSYKHL